MSISELRFVCLQKCSPHSGSVQLALLFASFSYLCFPLLLLPPLLNINLFAFSPTDLLFLSHQPVFPLPNHHSFRSFHPFSPKVTIWFLQTPLKKFSLFFYVFVFFLCLTVHSTFINISRLPAHLFFCPVVPQCHLGMWLEVCFHISETQTPAVIFLVKN